MICYHLGVKNYDINLNYEEFELSPHTSGFIRQKLRNCENGFEGFWKF